MKITLTTFLLVDKGTVIVLWTPEGMESATLLYQSSWTSNELMRRKSDYSLAVLLTNVEWSEDTTELEQSPLLASSLCKKARLPAHIYWGNMSPSGTSREGIGSRNQRLPTANLSASTRCAIMRGQGGFSACLSLSLSFSLPLSHSR